MEDEGRTLLPMFLLEVGGFMLIGLKQMLAGNMEHWDGTKSSIVEPYTLTKHCAGGQIHPRFIPAKPTDLEGNVVISPHIPGEKVCKT
jgi:hypothetical protein